MYSQHFFEIENSIIEVYGVVKETIKPMTDKMTSALNTTMLKFSK